MILASDPIVGPVKSVSTDFGLHYAVVEEAGREDLLSFVEAPGSPLVDHLVEWSLEGDLELGYRGKIRVHTKSNRNKDFLKPTGGPDYSAVWRDQRMTGVVAIGASLSNERKILLNEYLAYFYEQGFQFSTFETEDMKSFLIEGIATCELDWFLKESHSDGDERNMFRFARENYIIQADRGEDSKRQERIYLIVPKKSRYKISNIRRNDTGGGSAGNLSVEGRSPIPGEGRPDSGRRRDVFPSSAPLAVSSPPTETDLSFGTEVRLGSRPAPEAASSPLTETRTIMATEPQFLSAPETPSSPLTETPVIQNEETTVQRGERQLEENLTAHNTEPVAQPAQPSAPREVLKDTDVLPNMELGRAVAQRPTQKCGQITYFNSSCFSDVKARYEVEAVSSPLFLNIPAVSLTEGFKNRPDNALRALIHSFRQELDFEGFRQALKADNGYSSGIEDFYIFPDEEIYKERVFSAVSIPLDISVELFVRDGAAAKWRKTEPDEAL